MLQDEISEGLASWLDGLNLEDKQHEAMMLHTVSEDGWPHVAMISAGEVIALDRQRLRLALWKGTNTTANILRTGRAVLVAVHNGAVHSVRLKLNHLPELPHAIHPRERFEGGVVFVKEDTAKYAEVDCGVRMTLKDPAEVLRRWRETIRELRE